MRGIFHIQDSKMIKKPNKEKAGSGGAKKGDNIVSWAEFKGYFDAHKK